MKKVASTLAVIGVAFLSSIGTVSAAASWLPSQLTGANTPTSLNEVVSSFLTILLFVVVIGAVVYISLAGFKYISSQGDANKAKEAQAAITNAIIGVVVAFIAYFVVTFVLGQLGFNPDNFNQIEPTTQGITTVITAA